MERKYPRSARVGMLEPSNLDPQDVTPGHKIEPGDITLSDEIEHTKPTLGYYIRQYMNETGVHGCSKVGDGKAFVFRRCVWCVLLLTALGVLVYSVITEMELYFSYPTLTEIDYESRKLAPFPAVTICNLSPLSAAKLSVEDQKFLESILNAAFAERPELKHLAVSPNWSDPYYTQNGFFDPITDDTFGKYAMDLEKFIQFVMFDGKLLNVTRSFHRRNTHYGPCYTFNWEGKLSTRLSGEQDNLLLAVNINQLDYSLYGMLLAAGIKILVHSPDVLPDIFNEGIFIEPGKYAVVTITEQSKEFLPYPHQLKDGSYCNDTKDLSRTFKRCMTECLNEEILQKCGCIDINSQFSNQEKVCSRYQYLTCALPQIDSLVVSNTAFWESCVCPIPCIDSFYDWRISTATYPSFLYAQITQAMFGSPTAQERRNNELILRVRFGELGKTITRQVPKYPSVFSALANLGGTIGLFLGASVMTIFDILELFIFICYSYLTNAFSKNQRREKTASETKTSFTPGEYM